jgi:3D (Asp-Asp-Asp) domain-containing protein
MKSRLIPGRIRPISFILVIPLVILSLTVGLIVAQISFNLAVGYRLQQLESQISPIEVEIDDSDEVNPLEMETVSRGPVERNLVSLGSFNISYYCKCEKCCGKTDGITFTGANAAPNHTIAVDPDLIPLGTQLMIDGILYTAEDTGGAIQGNRVDIFVESHQEALERGRHQAEVFVYE